MILRIYLIISIFTFIFGLLVSIYVARKFHREHPEIQAPKMPAFEKFMSYFRHILVSFIPIFNILLVLIWLLAWDNCVEQVENRLLVEIKSWNN